MLSPTARKLSHVVRPVMRFYHTPNCTVHNETVIDELVKVIPYEYCFRNRKHHIEQNNVDLVTSIMREIDFQFMRRCGRNMTIEELQSVTSKIKINNNNY